MSRVDDRKLQDMAFAVLEEVAAGCRHAPQEKTRGLALALATLARVAGSPPPDPAQDRGLSLPSDPYALFWQVIGHERAQDRSAMVNAALNQLYVAAGRVRPVNELGKFEREAAERHAGMARRTQTA